MGEHPISEDLMVNCGGNDFDINQSVKEEIQDNQIHFEKFIEEQEGANCDSVMEDLFKDFEEHKELLMPLRSGVKSEDSLCFDEDVHQSMKGIKKEKVSDDNQWCNRTMKDDVAYVFDGENDNLSKEPSKVIQSRVKKEVEEDLASSYLSLDPCSDAVLKMEDYCTDEAVTKHEVDIQFAENALLDETLKEQFPEFARVKNRLKYLHDPLDRMSSIEDGKTSNIQNDNAYCCAHCNYSTGYRQSMVVHVLIHYKGKKKLFPCSICSYGTNRKSSLKRHMLVHNKVKERTFSCTICKYKTYCLRYLRAHTLSTHSGGYKGYACLCCEKRFKRKMALDDHIVKNHENFIDSVSSKLHECPKCNYKTTKKNNIDQHISSHYPKADAPCYKCNNCEYVTYDKSNYTKHLNMHRKRSFICNPCSKEFTQKTTLDNHIVTMHNDDAQLMSKVTYKIHNCSHCTYKTVFATHLKRHLERKHDL